MPYAAEAPRTIELSVAAPAYNEAENIAGVVREWRDYLIRHPAIGRWEIVVCDDGSTDATGAILAGLQRDCPELRVIRFPRNRGAGAAIAAAIAATRLDWVVLLDSDGQFPITNLDPFIDRILAGDGPAFTGVRMRKADDLAHRWGSALSGAVSNLLLGTRYRDFNSVFKVVHGPLFRSLPLESTGMNCSTEITARLAELGHTWIQLPIRHRPRGGGRRGWRFVRGARDRGLFVGYLAVRHWLLRLGVLHPPAVPGTDGTAGPPASPPGEGAAQSAEPVGRAR